MLSYCDDYRHGFVPNFNGNGFVLFPQVGTLTTVGFE